MSTATSRCGLSLLAYFVVVGLIGCSSSDPDITEISGSPSSTENGTENGEASSGEAQGGGEGTGSGTTPSETTPESEDEAGHSHLAPHTGGDVLTQLQGERKFVRMGDLLGCGDEHCQTLVIFVPDQAIEVMDAATGHLRKIYPLPKPMRHAQVNHGMVRMMDFNSIEYGDGPPAVYHLDLSTGNLTREFELPSYGRSFRSSSQYLAFTSNDGLQIQVSRLSSPHEVMFTLSHPKKITHLALSDAYVVASDEFGYLSAWRLPSGEVVAMPKDIKSYGALTVEGTQVYFEKRWNSLGRCHLETGDHYHFSHEVYGSIYKIVVFKDQWIVSHRSSISFLAPLKTAGNEGKLALEKTLSFPDQLRQLAVSENTVITQSSAYLQFWDIQTGSEVKKVLDHPSSVAAFGISDRQLVGVGEIGMSAWLHVFDLATGTLLHKLPPQQIQSFPALAMGGNLLAVSLKANTIGLWSAETGEFLGELTGHTDKIRAMAISNQVLVSSAKDDTIRVWDLSMKQPIKVITKSYSYIQTLDISGDYIAYQVYEKLMIRNWKTEDPSLINDFGGGSVGEGSVSIVDPWVITCGYDFVLRIWNLKTGELLKSFAIASTFCALDRSRTDVIRLAGTNEYSVEVLEIDPKTLEGRVIASETPQRLEPRRTFRVSEPSHEFKVHVVDHRSWFRRTWEQLTQWFQTIF